MDNPLVTVDALSYTYPRCSLEKKRQALSGISLAIREGGTGCDHRAERVRGSPR
ncbi:hypothetical protein [Methanogenium cariaci]|uniref:hypothetical protein n=1 Tax=Methanogenium cariaci TaxID=2197 RepID=UPI0012F65C6D|nr:hypothetical protein [Methanogenium cariaci]